MSEAAERLVLDTVELNVHAHVYLVQPSSERRAEVLVLAVGVDHQIRRVEALCRQIVDGALDCVSNVRATSVAPSEVRLESVFGITRSPAEKRFSFVVEGAAEEGDSLFLAALKHPLGRLVTELASPRVPSDDTLRRIHQVRARGVGVVDEQVHSMRALAGDRLVDGFPDGLSHVHHDVFHDGFGHRLGDRLEHVFHDVFHDRLHDGDAALKDEDGGTTGDHAHLLDVVRKQEL